MQSIRRPPPPPPAEESVFLTLCYNFATSPIADSFMCSVTVVNVIQLTLTHEGESPGMTTFMDVASDAFTGIFTAEAALKIVGLRPFW